MQQTTTSEIPTKLIKIYHQCVLRQIVRWEKFVAETPQNLLDDQLCEKFQKEISDEIFANALQIIKWQLTTFNMLDTSQQAWIIRSLLKTPPAPQIKIRWLRDQDHIAFSRPLTYLILGQRGSGKSSLLEVLGTRYPKVFDIFGSSDNEGLGYCKAEYLAWFRLMYHREPRILLIEGVTRDTASKFDSIKIDKVTLESFTDYDVIITVHAFYQNEGEYFSALQKIVHLLWDCRTWWKEPWFVLIREAANWIYARMKMTKDDKMAKAEFIKSLREARHHGLAIGVDTLRWTGIDKEVRDVCDHIFIKKVGDTGLPPDLWWMYRYVWVERMRKLKPGTIVLKTTTGAVGVGYFDYPPWHKEERENILEITGIEVKDSGVALPEDKRYGVGAFEHAEIITKYIQLGSIRKVQDILIDRGETRSSSTIHRHIQQHNRAIEKAGVCKKCAHSKSEFSKDYIKEISRE